MTHELSDVTWRSPLAGEDVSRSRAPCETAVPNSEQPSLIVSSQTRDRSGGFDDCGGDSGIRASLAAWDGGDLDAITTRFAEDGSANDGPSGEEAGGGPAGDREYPSSLRIENGKRRRNGPARDDLAPSG